MSWPAARSPPSSAYLLADAQPAMSTPITEIDDTARAKKTPVSRASTTASGPTGEHHVQDERRHQHDHRGQHEDLLVGTVGADVLLLEELDGLGDELEGAVGGRVSIGPRRLCMWAIILNRNT